MILKPNGQTRVRLWDTESGQLVHTFKGHTRAVSAIAFSRDDQQCDRPKARRVGKDKQANYAANFPPIPCPPKPRTI